MTEKRKRRAPKAPAQGSGETLVVREPTEREIAQRERQKARNRARPERPESTFARDGKKLEVGPAEGQDAPLYGVAMMEAFGTRSIPFLNDTLRNINCVFSKTGIPTETQYNAAVAVLAAVEPENELEATLAAQMVAANECAMRCMRGMGVSDYADQHRMYGDLANKFMRTFTAQVEALARLRRKGEQVVKHVHVHEGGQAVVAGTINQGGINGGSGEQPRGTGVFEECAALPCPDPEGNGVPVPGYAQREMSHSRRP